MRFSSLFQISLTQRPAAVPEAPARADRVEEPQAASARPATAPADDLPDDLDARVRLVGEWQLGMD